jgi:hypothetical protein
MSVTGTWLDENNDLFYIREVEGSGILPLKLVRWFAEEKTGAWANVFIGVRLEDEIFGSWADVPKGYAQKNGGLSLTVANDETQITALNVTGGFGSTSWTRAPASYPIPPATFVPPRFQEANLTGTWLGDDGATYYVRQIGSKVWWIGEHPNGAFSNVFVGRVSNRTVEGSWADVPKGTGSQDGKLTLVAAFPGWRTLGVTAQTGGFGCTRLSKVDAMDVRLELDTFQILANNEGSDEPYIWPVYIKIDGETVSLLSPSTATTTVYSPKGSHGDLGAAAEDMKEGGPGIKIPKAIGRFDTRLFTVLDAPLAAAEAFSLLTVGVIGMEEDGTSDAAAEEGRITLRDSLQGSLDNVVRTALLSGVPPNLNDISDQVVDDVVSAITSETISVFSVMPVTSLFDLPGIVDPDDYVGYGVDAFGAIPLFRFHQIRNAGEEGIPFALIMPQTSEGEGWYRVTGRVRAI